MSFVAALVVVAVVADDVVVVAVVGELKAVVDAVVEYAVAAVVDDEYKRSNQR